MKKNGRETYQKERNDSSKGVCIKTGKAAFGTKKAAVKRLDGLRSQRGEIFKVERAYKCSFCEKWHFTSKEQTK